MTTVCYVSPEAPKFSMRVVVDGADHRIQFANKELRLDEESDVALIAAIDKLIATKPNISTIIHKVDMAAAEKIARAHRIQQLGLGGAIKGSVSADDARRPVDMAMREREAELAAQGATAEDLDKMRDEMARSSLTLTEDAKGIVEPSNREGFVPAAIVPNTAPASDAANVAEAKNVFANLGKKK